MEIDDLLQDEEQLFGDYKPGETAKRPLGDWNHPGADLPRDSGAASKRSRLTEVEIDDEELLALAFSQPVQCPQPPLAAAQQPRPALQRPAPMDVDLEDDLDQLLNPTATCSPAPSRSRQREQLVDDGTASPAPSSPGSPIAKPAPEEVKVARHATDIRGEVFMVTAESGERVFCQMTSNTGTVEAAGSGVATACGSSSSARKGQLLGRPIMELLEAVDEEAFQAALRRAELEQQLLDRRAASASAATSQTPDEPAPGEALWVDKYSPRSFKELLSDEQINRTVLKWLKAWDGCVFAAAPPGAGGGLRAVAKKQNAAKRPDAKILLISGAPGLGKTTLAHVVAQHCGYRPVEINASDDRTEGSLVTRVQDAVQFQSVMGSRRPNCIIVDEIDGATGGSEGRGAIQALIKIATAAAGKATSAGEDDEGVEEDEPRAKRKGRKRPRPLCRPIICICNDLYAPALRPLRDVAQVVQFKQPLAERLVARLRMICSMERLHVDRQVLTALAERTEFDVRACLNTLQFLARRRAAVRMADLDALNVGQKDIKKSAFSVWQQLLCNKAGKGRAAESGALGGERRLRLVQEFGESELLVAGLQENLLALRVRDTHLRRTAAMAATLQTADTLLRRCHRTSNYALLKYLPSLVVSIASTAAGPDRVTIQWPRAQAEAGRRQAGSLALLHHWLPRVSPSVFSALSPHRAVMEVVPALVAILGQPALRPVAAQLRTAAERTALVALADTMLAYAVTFDLSLDTPVPGPAPHMQQGAAPLLSHLPLKPAIDRMCLFPGLGPQAKALPLAVRQLLAHEAELEAIRRADAARGQRTTAADDSKSQQQGGSTVGTIAAETASPAPAKSVFLTVAARAAAAASAAAAGVRKAGPQRRSNWMEQLKEQKERRRTVAVGQKQVPGAAQPAGAKPALTVLYKFHEGYTNAVKRPVVMRDLI